MIIYQPVKYLCLQLQVTVVDVISADSCVCRTDDSLVLDGQFCLLRFRSHIRGILSDGDAPLFVCSFVSLLSCFS